MGLIGGASAVAFFTLGFLVRKVVLQKHSLLDLWLGSLVAGPLYSAGVISPGDSGITSAIVAVGAVLLPKGVVGFLIGWWIGVRASEMGDSSQQVLWRVFFFVLVIEALSLIGYTVG